MILLYRKKVQPQIQGTLDIMTQDFPHLVHHRGFTVLQWFTV